MKQDITFLCQFFYPETISSATLPFDTASYLASKGYSVGAMCGYPGEYCNKKDVALEEVKDGVHIRRLKYIRLSRKNRVGRLVNYLSFILKAWLRVRELKDSRAVMVYSNPPVLPLVALRAKKKYGTKLIFVAYDVYPEIAYASGAIAPGSILAKVMNRINRSLYAQADAVVALTDEMRQYLLDNRPELTPDRVFTVENWAHEKENASLDPRTPEKFGFTADQFVVGYFGNLGTCQDVDTLLRTALLMKEDPKVGFLIAGHGNKKEAVKAFVSQHALENIRLLNYLTGEDFSQAMALASCSVVSLQRGLMGTCAPSKYYSCLLAGHPVVAVVEKESYIARELQREGVGYYVANGDAAAFRKAILAMRDDPEMLRQMRGRARQLYKSKYDYSIAMEKYRGIFEKLL